MVYRCIVWVGSITTPEQQQKLADLSKKSYFGCCFPVCRSQLYNLHFPLLLEGNNQIIIPSLKLPWTLKIAGCYSLLLWGRREGSGDGVRERCKKVGQSKGEPHQRIGQKERHGRPTWQCFDQGGHQGWFRPRGSGGL